uniref:Uncharacterized protein n=1 Tax=Salvator merianae TaxID=96440 RepID=A0A8D0B5C1_SALMN
MRVFIRGGGNFYINPRKSCVCCQPNKAGSPGCSSLVISYKCIFNFPLSIMLYKGKNVTLECTQDSGHNPIFWLWQRKGQHLQLLYNFYYRKEQQKSETPDRFRAGQPKMHILT